VISRHSKRIAVVALIGTMAIGCASVNQRVAAYPAHGQSWDQVQADQAHCRVWAEHSAADPVRSAAIGAGVGAVIVGGIGAAFGAILYAAAGMNPAEGAAIGGGLGAIVGAVEGAGGSAAGAEQQQERAYVACMTTRGYTVVH
jgi:hypothetical protein